MSLVTNLSVHEMEMIVRALEMRCNYIETCDPVLSAVDVKNILEARAKDKHSWKGYFREPKIEALTSDQMEMIVDMRRIIKRLQKKIQE